MWNNFLTSLKYTFITDVGCVFSEFRRVVSFIASVQRRQRFMSPESWSVVW